MLRPAPKKSLSLASNNSDLSPSKPRNDGDQNGNPQETPPNLHTRVLQRQPQANAEVVVATAQPKSPPRAARPMLLREKSHGRAEPRIVKNREDRTGMRMADLLADDLTLLDWDGANTASTFLRADTPFVKAMTRELEGSLSNLARDCFDHGMRQLKGVDTNSGKEHDKAICKGLTAMVDCFMESALPSRFWDIVRAGDQKIFEERIRRSEAAPGCADAYCDYEKKLKKIYIPAILLRTLISELSNLILKEFPALGSCQRKQADLLKSMLNRCFSGPSQATTKKIIDQGLGASYAKFISTFEDLAEVMQFYLTFHPSR